MDPQPPVVQPMPPPLKKSFPIIWALVILLFGISIGVGGLWGYQSYMQPKGTLLGPYTPAPEPTPTDPTANWITYTNSKYGFSFKYPNTMHLLQNPYVKTKEDISNSKNLLVTNDTLESYSPGGWAGVFISILDNPSRLTAKNYVSNNIQNNGTLTITQLNKNNLDVVVTKGEIQIGNRDETPIIYIAYQNWIIKIDPNTNLYVETSNQILSTFQFTGAASIATPTPAYLTKTYTDKQIGYAISYNDTWEFRRTYGSDIPKGAPTDILSGIDMHKRGVSSVGSVIAVNVLDAHGLTDIAQWIQDYDLNYPQTAAKQIRTFGKDPAIVYRYRTNPNEDGETWYFIHGAYTYRLFVHESQEISEETRTVLESFVPK